MPQFDTVIKGGTIVDGTRNRRFVGDIAIRDGVIAKVGKIDPAEAENVIDATGLVVAPGMIDAHTHYDAQIYWDPYLSSSGWHGITTVAVGNCGFGFAPTQPELRERSMLAMTKVEAIPYDTMKAALKWDWVTFPEFLDSVDRQPKSINMIAYMPLNPLLIWTLGIDDAKKGRKPTDAENVEMAKLLDEAMDAGAIGWSVQATGNPGQPDGWAMESGQSDYDGTALPGDVMWPETRRALAEVLGRRGEGVIMMAAGPAVTFQEWEELATISGAPMLMQAVIAGGEGAPDYASKGTRQFLYGWFKSCQERGLRIYGQGLTSDLPLLFTFEYFDLWPKVWQELLGPDVPKDVRLANLADPDARARLRDCTDIPQATGRPEKTTLRETFTDKYKQYEGMLVDEIGAKLGIHPIDALCDIVLADNLKTQFETVQMFVDKEGQEDVISHPYVVPGQSDGGAHSKYLVGASYGTEFITHFVREYDFIDLEEAHWRLSCFPASVLGIKDRGTLSEGLAADIIVYDYANLNRGRNVFSHDLPADEYRVVNRPSGYRYVLVNGEVTIKDDQETGRHSGSLLRGGRGERQASQVLTAQAA